MNNTKYCDECGSRYFTGSAEMSALCPECAHVIYGYPNCAHVFEDGRCNKCHWDGSTTAYVRSLKERD